VKPATDPRLLIPQAIYAAIQAQAAAESPNECCGLLAGPMPESDGDYRVAGHFPLVNALASPTEFESEPRGLFAAHRTMCERGWEILAVYHSHPTSPPIPSKKDRALSYAPEIVTLIMSLSAGETRGWWIRGDEVREAQLQFV
jgi:[CysO sulfur-carrier protein]-S-L-cysteine hydrolase